MNIEKTMDELVDYFTKFNLRRDEALTIFLTELVDRTNLLPREKAVGILSEKLVENSAVLAEGIATAFNELGIDKATGIIALMSVVVSILNQDPEEKMPFLADLILNLNPYLSVNEAVNFARTILKHAPQKGVH